MENLKWTLLEPIEKGWSADKKYKAVDRDGRTVLLRISPLKRQESREKLYEILHCLPDTLSISRPLDMGLCEDGIWSTYTWIDGIDAETVIPGLSQEEQYRLGYRAGEILRQIHTAAAPTDLEDWSVRFGRKIDHKLEQYRDCPVQYADGEKIVDFVKENRWVIEGRPQRFQHGDYHIGNMMMENGHLKIIDFDRFDFGDPWEEFSRIVWNVQASPAFAVGQIEGYFENRPPEGFFRAMALYIAVNTLSSLPWSLPFGQEQTEVFMAQERQIMDWYDGFADIVPKWYREHKKR